MGLRLKLINMQLYFHIPHFIVFLFKSDLHFSVLTLMITIMYSEALPFVLLCLPFLLDRSESAASLNSELFISFRF